MFTPGQNVRRLAQKRRIRASPYLLAAMFSLGLATLFLNSPVILAVLVLIAIVNAIRGASLLELAKRADQGAAKRILAKPYSLCFKMAGKLNLGVRLGRSLADIDIVCTSPQQKTYAIEVKSHRGKIFTKKQKLYRHLGKSQRVFEKDFLAQAKYQALQVKEKRNLSYVTPILVFANAQVSINASQIQKVYVVEKSQLVPLLKSLG